MRLSIYDTWPYDYARRKWQFDVEAKFQALRLAKNDFFIVACPGSGKTDATLILVVGLFEAGLAQRLVIVCPTNEVCNQWKEKAARFGIQLTRAGAELKDFDGVVVTYHQVISGWEIHRTGCAREKTVVIFDEIHHCADGKGWGDMIRQAFEGAAYRISLSGTPFRQGNERIPFVEYDDEGICRPDHTYGYQEALNDRDVCRLAFFPTIDGSAEWVMNGQRKSAVLTEEKLSEGEVSALFRTFLDPHGKWIATTIRAARDKTDQCRALGHADAGELWLCIDQNHARSMGESIHKITGDLPVVVTSDDPKAATKIKNFRQGNQKCLVSVKMVCEGVDIQRLRVLVYATNVVTELFFRQALGRIIRYVTGLDEQAAYFFLPRVPSLVKFALEVIKERTHHLDLEALSLSKEAQARLALAEGANRLPSYFEPGPSEGIISNVIGPNASEFSQEALGVARSVQQHLRSRVQVEELALALLGAGLIRPGTSGSAPTAKEYEKPLEDRKWDFRRQIERIVNVWAKLDQAEEAAIHREWIRISGVPTAQATIEDLQRKLDWSLDGLAAAQQRALDGR